MARLLIVEDEVLIADALARYLEAGGYEVAAVAASYEEAIEAVADVGRFDLALLDIQIDGERDGIELARYFRAEAPKIVRVFLTSQYDEDYLRRAQATLPAGYITKPVQRATLLATVGVALHNARAAADADAAEDAATYAAPAERLTLRDGQENHAIDLSAIRYLSVDHVYVEYHRANGPTITIREPLQTALERLPRGAFVQVHRKYAVAVAHVESWTSTTVQVGGEVLPVSRGRRW